MRVLSLIAVACALLRKASNDSRAALLFRDRLSDENEGIATAKKRPITATVATISVRDTPFSDLSI